MLNMMKEALQCKEVKDVIFIVINVLRHMYVVTEVSEGI